MTKVLALCYHDIYSNNDILLSGFNEGGSNLYKIKDYDFEAQLKSLISTKDIEIILVNQVRDSKSNNKNILLTFDDGGITSYTKIFPLLEKYGIKGHFFIVGNKIGKKGFVDANQLREIRSYGHIIGTHSFSHPDNITLLSSMDIKNEWKNGVKAIEDILGEKITTCSLPNGFNSKIVREKAFQEGLLYLFTSQPTLKVRGDNSFYIIGRYPVQAHHKNKYIASLSKRNFPTLIKHNILWSIKSVLRSLGGDTYLLFRKKILSRRK